MSEPSRNMTTGCPPKRHVLPDRYRDNRLWAITEAVSCIPLAVLSGAMLLHMVQSALSFLGMGPLIVMPVPNPISRMPLALYLTVAAFGVLYLLTPHLICLIARRPVVLPCPHCGAKPETKGWFFDWHCPNMHCPGCNRPGGWETRKEWNLWAGVVREFLDTGRTCACCGKTIGINTGMRNGKAYYVAECGCATGEGGRIEDALDERASKANKSKTDEDGKRRRQSDAAERLQCMKKYADMLNADSVREKS